MTKVPTHRTQFDALLLADNHAASPALCANHGRQMRCDNGALLTALVEDGEKPKLNIWRDRQLVAEYPLLPQPSAPCLAANAKGDVDAWISAGETIFRASITTLNLEPVTEGVIEDVDREAVLLRRGDTLLLGFGAHTWKVDEAAGHASLDFDEDGLLHIAYEKAMGIEYCCVDIKNSASGLNRIRSERIAEAYGSHPVILCHDLRVIVTFLGEMCRKPSYKRWSDAWERLGHGGYIGALVLDKGQWNRFRLADSRQIVKPLRPIDTAFGGGPEVESRLRIEEFSPPSLTLGPDGVPQVLWANITRRWAYACRYLGEEFSSAIHVRGPLEQFTGPVLVSKRLPVSQPGIPMGLITKSRVYLDELVLPSRTIQNPHRVDFIQLDEVASLRGLETVSNTLSRHPDIPVIRVGERGSYDDGAVLADVSRDGKRWKANLHYQKKQASDPHVKAETWRWDGRAISEDGIHWTKLDPLPLAEQSVIGESARIYNIRYIEDPSEGNPQCRFKGFWRAPYGGPWAWLPVVSGDAKTWTKVSDTHTVVNADDDLRVWIDPDDISERRFKASAISRSFCGRVCAQWSSPDGMHWNDERDTLDFKDPFGAKPDAGTTGRILLDSWAGPDDEDELHGGYVFRDGDRWLLHYMKWSPDGHIQLALASSRDGINFSRVADGASTLPLGPAGAWDAGRVAIREAPFRVGNAWRQYYAGCGWKHGLAGIGAKTSHWASQHSPMQTGIAEIPIGHWVYLALRRDADDAECQTIPLHLSRPCALTLDMEGVNRVGSRIRCCVIDANTGVPIEGLDYANCDPMHNDGHEVTVSWRERGTTDIGPGRIRIGVEWSGHGIKLFGLNLKPT